MRHINALQYNNCMLTYAFSVQIKKFTKSYIKKYYEERKIARQGSISRNVKRT